jgi:hypothetical protein
MWVQRYIAGNLHCGDCLTGNIWSLKDQCDEPERAGGWMGADKNYSRRRWRLQQDEHGFQHTSPPHYPSCPVPRNHWSATGPRNQQPN